MRYRYFGFALESDLPFPELPPAAGTPPALVLRHDPARTASPADWFHDVRTARGRPWLSIGRAADAYALEYHGRLSLRYRSPHLAWSRTDALADDSLRHILLDQALPLVFAQEGHTILHGACAADGDSAVLFAGPAGAGKSTLVAALLSRGWHAASDDAALVTVKGDQVLVQPAYAGLRLWPDSCLALAYGGGTAIGGGSDKRRFDAAPFPAQARLRAICVVRKGGARAGPSARTLARREALMALVRNAYVLDVADKTRARAALDALATVASRVPVLALTVPHHFEAIGELVSLLSGRLA